MALHIHTTFMLLICIGLLLFQPNEVCGSKNADFALAEGRRDQPAMVKNRRMLKAVDMKSLGINKKQVPERIRLCIVLLVMVYSQFTWMAFLYRFGGLAVDHVHIECRLVINRPWKQSHS